MKAICRQQGVSNPWLSWVLLLGFWCGCLEYRPDQNCDYLFWAIIPIFPRPKESYSFFGFKWVWWGEDKRYGPLIRSNTRTKGGRKGWQFSLSDLYVVHGARAMDLGPSIDRLDGLHLETLIHSWTSICLAIMVNYCVLVIVITRWSNTFVFSNRRKT